MERFIKSYPKIVIALFGLLVGILGWLVIQGYNGFLQKEEASSRAIKENTGEMRELNANFRELRVHFENTNKDVGKLWDVAGDHEKRITTLEAKGP